MIARVRNTLYTEVVMATATAVKVSIAVSLLALVACKSSGTQTDANMVNDAVGGGGSGGQGLGDGAAGGGGETCIAGSCPQGQVCAHYVNPPGRQTYSACRQDPCAAAGMPLSCDCAMSVCENAPGCSAGTGELNCIYSLGAPAR